jgi:hypothetical protein
MPVQENEVRQRFIGFLFLKQKLDRLLAIVSNYELPQDSVAGAIDRCINNAMI